MNKTHVSILQEYAIRLKKDTPRYIFVEDKIVGLNHEFTMRVMCGGLSAEGQDFTKQGAKHKAAEQMLLKLSNTEEKFNKVSVEKLSLNDSISSVNSDTSSSGTGVNYIGLIHELCAKKKIQLPVFNEIGSTGPDHLKSFTIRCVLADITEEATETTKKQAKTEAAKKVWHKLSSKYSNATVVPDNFLMIPETKTIKSTPLNDSIDSVESNANNNSEAEINYIGLLNEYCSQKKKNQPIYTVVTSFGPNHAMKFTIRCQAVNIVEEETANTKKQAKNEAAKKVWLKLPNKLHYSLNKHIVQKELDDFKIPLNVVNIEEVIPDYTEENKFAEKKYLELTNLQVTPLISETVSLDECHKVFSSGKYSIPLRKKILDFLVQINTESENVYHVSEYEFILNKIASLLDIKITKLDFQVNKFFRDANYIVGYRLHSQPMILAMGSANTSDLANLKAIFDATESLKILLN